VAFYSRADSWIEMRLRASRPMRVRVPAAGIERSFARGEEIRTEISCKYTRERLGALLPPAFAIEQWWTDERRWFALALLRRVPTR
jgi:L-histidine N-alpha-methyltransferase